MEFREQLLFNITVDIGATHRAGPMKGNDVRTSVYGHVLDYPEASFRKKSHAFIIDLALWLWKSGLPSFVDSASSDAPVVPVSQFHHEAVVPDHERG